MYNTSMKKIILTIIAIFIFLLPSYAASINAAAYKTMQAKSYRDNYNRQTSGVTPYWKLQSNYATRNRMYNSYSNYNNSVNQFNYNTRMYRGRY